MNTAKKTTPQTKTEKKTERDLAFERKLSGFSKHALTMALSQLTMNEGTRKFILDYIQSMESLMDAAHINQPSLMDSIFHAVRSERATQDQMNGPVQMNPRTVPEWMDRLSRLVTKASGRASMGQDQAALKLILWIARDAVACLEDRIESIAEDNKAALAEAINDVMKHPEDNVDVLLEMGVNPNEDTELSTLKEIGRNGISYRGHYYWGSWMSDCQGKKVKLQFPCAPRSVKVIDASDGGVLGEAYRMGIVPNGRSEMTDGRSEKAKDQKGQSAVSPQRIKTRTIHRNGVRVNGTFYWADWMKGLEGEKVDCLLRADNKLIVKEEHAGAFLGIVEEAETISMEEDSDEKIWKDYKRTRKNNPTDDVVASPAGETESTNEG